MFHWFVCDGIDPHKHPPASAFTTGDVVTLKSGGEPMTVFEVGVYTGWVFVARQDEQGNVYCVVFPPSMLVKVGGRAEREVTAPIGSVKPWLRCGA